MVVFLKSATIGGFRVANCASTWANHTSGLDSQKVCNLMATAWIAGAGSSLGTALRACAIARTSSAFRVVIASSTSGSPLWHCQLYYKQIISSTQSATDSQQQHTLSSKTKLTTQKLQVFHTTVFRSLSSNVRVRIPSATNALRCQSTATS